MNLKEFRANKGFQRKFVVAGVGICGKHLNDIEAGRVNLTDNVATKLSELYSVDVNTIKTMYKEGKNEEYFSQHLLSVIQSGALHKTMPGRVYNTENELPF